MALTAAFICAGAGVSAGVGVSEVVAALGVRDSPVWTVFAARVEEADMPVVVVGGVVVVGLGATWGGTMKA